MFGSNENQYKSDVVLGEKYRDEQTGIEGVAIGLTFWQHACERAIIERVGQDGKLEEYTFDSPRLVNVKTEQKAKSTKTGGPDRGSDTRPSTPTRR